MRIHSRYWDFDPSDDRFYDEDLNYIIKDDDLKSSSNLVLVHYHKISDEVEHLVSDVSDKSNMLVYSSLIQQEL